MLMRLALAAACWCATLAGAVQAQGPDDGRGRFSLSPVDDGFIRLDKETGAVAMCARKAAEWVCEAVADKTQAASEKSKLETENQVLKDRVKSLEESLETGKPQANSDAPAGTPSGKMQLPTEEEVDKALDYVERMFKKFRDRVQKLEPAPATPSPPSGGSGAL